MIHDGSPEEAKTWGCFHLNGKAGKWPPSLLERTFDGQRTANGKAVRGRPEWSDHYVFRPQRDEKTKTNYTKNAK